MGEVSDEGLEERLYKVIFELNNDDFMPLTSVYIDAIKAEGWVPGTHVARARALMEDAQRELAKEKAKNEELEEKIKKLQPKPISNITITDTSIAGGTITSEAIKRLAGSRISRKDSWGTVFSWPS